MAKGLTKVVYKPDSQSTDEYIAIVNPEQVCQVLFLRRQLPIDAGTVDPQYKKWKDGGDYSSISSMDGSSVWLLAFCLDT